MKVINMKDATLDNITLKVMVVGETGTGKSKFASTFPSPVLLFDFDKGKTSYMGKDVDVVQYDGNAEDWVRFAVTRDKNNPCDLDDAIANGKYKTLIIDSATTMSDIALRYAMTLEQKMGIGGGAGLHHYGIQRGLVEGAINKALQFKGNVVLIAHISPEKDEVTGQMHLRPALVGQLSTKVPCLFDEVYYASTRPDKAPNRVGKVEYVLQTISSGYYKGRSRLAGIAGNVPDFIPNSYPALLALVNKGDGK